MSIFLSRLGISSKKSENFIDGEEVLFRPFNSNIYI